MSTHSPTGRKMDSSVYSFSSPRHQQFSLPTGIIYYLIKNCLSLDVFLKLQQICKDISSKSKIIILNKLISSDSNSFYYLKNGKQKLKEKSQYWLTFHLEIKSNSVFPKCIYRCTLEKLEIRGKNLTFKEINFLLNGKKIEYLDLLDVNIKYENGKPVTMDAIVKRCPKITKLFYSNLCENFSNETFQKLIQFKLYNKLENLELIISSIKEYKIYTRIFCRFLQNIVDQNSMANIWFKCKFEKFDDFTDLIKNNLKDFCTKKLTINHDF